MQKTGSFQTPIHQSGVKTMKNGLIKGNILIQGKKKIETFESMNYLSKKKNNKQIQLILDPLQATKSNNPLKNAFKDQRKRANWFWAQKSTQH